MNSVLQDWVMTIPKRKQGTLVAGIRGCDGIPKGDISKIFTRALRREILNPADPDWKTNEPAGFFDSPEITQEVLDKFVHQLDHYPLHWVTHFYLAVEVVAYHYPDKKIRDFWFNIYAIIVFALHLNPEKEEDFHSRLSDGLRLERFRK